jgi:hypothetical protein
MIMPSAVSEVRRRFARNSRSAMWMQLKNIVRRYLAPRPDQGLLPEIGAKERDGHVIDSGELRPARA